MNSNPIIYLDVFLSDQKCIDIFKKTLSQFKKLNLPIFVITNFSFPQELFNQVNYVFYDYNNLFFKEKYSKYELLVTWSVNSIRKIEKFDVYHQKYGLSLLSNSYKGISIIRSLGYDSIIRLEWDNHIGDKDLEVFKKFINDFTSNDYHGKFLINKNHETEEVLRSFSWLISAVNVDYFLRKFPKILSEQDYISHLYEKFKNNDFKSVERVLYYSLLDGDRSKIKLDDIDQFKLQLTDTSINTHISKVNYSELNSNTTEQVFGRFENDPGSYIFYTHNVCFVNQENPNFQTVTYQVCTKKRDFTVTHTVNTGCWASTTHKFDPDEFPIKIKCGEKEISYESIEDINVKFTKL